MNDAQWFEIALVGFAFAIVFALLRDRWTARGSARRYTWKPDLPDFRDQRFVAAPMTLPTALDMRAKCPEVYDQSTLGSCTGNGIAGVLEIDQIRQGLRNWTPSRLFIYWCERDIDGTTKQDSGAMIRDGIKVVAKTGYCPETLWPYLIGKFKTKPSKACFDEAAKHKVAAYQRLDNTKLVDLKTCIAMGNPIVFGMTVYDSFESQAVARTGLVPMPKASDKDVGGHCMVIVGFDDAKQCFIVRNSWGKGWGDKGYCYIPYAYLTSKSLASDFWTITVVSKLGVAA